MTEERRQGMTEVLIAIENLKTGLKANNNMTKEIHDVIYKDGLLVKIERNTMFRKFLTWAVGIAIASAGVVLTVIKIF